MSNGSAMKNIPPFADLKGMIADIPSMKEQYCMGNFFLTLIPSLPFINDSNSWKLIEKGVKLWMILTKNQILKRL